MKVGYVCFTCRPRHIEHVVLVNLDEALGARLATSRAKKANDVIMIFHEVLEIILNFDYFFFVNQPLAHFQSRDAFELPLI